MPVHDDQVARRSRFGSGFAQLGSTPMTERGRMNSITSGGWRRCHASRAARRAGVGLAFASAWLISGPAAAFEFDTGSDLKARLDNTLKYSDAWRVKGRSDALVADPNLDDGDRNFKRGLDRLATMTMADFVTRLAR